jgi:hypothetical protein
MGTYLEKKVRTTTVLQIEMLSYFSRTAAEIFEFIREVQ